MMTVDELREEAAARYPGEDEFSGARRVAFAAGAQWAADYYRGNAGKRIVSQRDDGAAWQADFYPDAAR